MGDGQENCESHQSGSKGDLLGESSSRHGWGYHDSLVCGSSQWDENGSCSTERTSECTGSYWGKRRRYPVSIIENPPGTSHEDSRQGNDSDAHYGNGVGTPLYGSRSGCRKGQMRSLQAGGGHFHRCLTLAEGGMYPPLHQHTNAYRPLTASSLTRRTCVTMVGTSFKVGPSGPAHLSSGLLARQEPGPSATSQTAVRPRISASVFAQCDRCHIPQL
jgi:hypothetical protein